MLLISFSCALYQLSDQTKGKYLGDLLGELLHCSASSISFHKYFTDLQLVQQESLHPESSAPVEDVYVDKKAVDQLTEGFLTHYLPDLQNSKRALQELT